MTKNTLEADLSDSNITENDEEQRAADVQNLGLHSHVAQNAVAPNNDLPEVPAKESGGQAGLDPTRYGDWEKKGRCTDF